MFTHRERAGQRGFVDVSSEAQPEEGENQPAEVVMLGLESASSTSGCDSNDCTFGHRTRARIFGGIAQVWSRNIGTRHAVRESSALEVPLPHAVRARREEFPPMSRYVEIAPWETLDHDTLEKTSTQSFLL